MELFKGQSLLEFTERFKTDLDCEEYLASLKWEDGYCCRISKVNQYVAKQTPQNANLTHFKNHYKINDYMKK